MDLGTSVSHFSSGAAIQDTVTPGLTSMTSQTSGMSGLSSIPGMSTALTTINSMISSATTAWNSVLSQLSVALPAMKAVHVLESKLSMAVTAGMAPVKAGSTSFQAYFGAIDNVKAQITSLSSSVTSNISTMASHATSIAGVTGSGPAALASLASKIPAQTISDGSGGQMTNPAFTSFMSTNSGAISSLTSNAGSLSTLASAANTSVTAQFTAASTAFTNGVSSLKGMAFASFCAQPQPQAVADVIAKTIDPAAIPIPPVLSHAARAVQTWSKNQQTAATDPGSVSEATPTATNPEPGLANAQVKSDPSNFTASGCSPAQLSAIDAQVASQFSVWKTAAQGVETAKANIDSYITSINWIQIRGNQASNPTLYASTLATLQASPQYAALTSTGVTMKSARQLYNKLQSIQIYMHSSGPLTNNPNGPWTVNDFIPGDAAT